MYLVSNNGAWDHSLSEKQGDETRRLDKKKWL